MREKKRFGFIKLYIYSPSKDVKYTWTKQHTNKKIIIHNPMCIIAQDRTLSLPLLHIISSIITSHTSSSCPINIASCTSFTKRLFELTKSTQIIQRLDSFQMYDFIGYTFGNIQSIWFLELLIIPQK